MARASTLFFVFLSLLVLVHANGGGDGGDDDDDGPGNNGKCRRLPPFAAVRCSRNSDCGCVTDRPGFATCYLGFCYCNPKQGFSGNATVANKCRCDQPKEVIYAGERKGSGKDQVPYCINPVAAANADFEAQRCERLKGKVARLYQLTVWPNPIAVLTGQINLDDVFHPESQARISPLGVYHGIIGVEEYFYGLPSNPQSSIHSIDLPWLICSGLQVSVLVNFLFKSPAGFPALEWNLTEHALFTFNEAELVINTEGAIVNLGAIVDPKDIPGVPGSAEQIIQQQIAGVCALMVTGIPLPDGGFLPPTCTGAHKNYDSLEECIGFMNSIPRGSWYRANSNTWTCRQLHSILTSWRPEVHCAHAGKTGGGKCVDFTYESYYTEGVFVGNPHNL